MPERQNGLMTFLTEADESPRLSDGGVLMTVIIWHRRQRGGSPMQYPGVLFLRDISSLHAKWHWKNRCVAGSQFFLKGDNMIH